MKTGFKMTHHHMNIFQHPNTPSTHKKNRKGGYGGVLLATNLARRLIHLRLIQ